MDDQMLQFLFKNGIFATLFVALFLYVLKENKKRENRMLEVIEKLTDKIEEDIKKIKEYITNE